MARAELHGQAGRLTMWFDIRFFYSSFEKVFKITKKIDYEIASVIYYDPNEPINPTLRATFE